MKKHYLVSGFANGAQSMSRIFIPLLAASFGATPFEIGLIAMLFGASMFISNFVFGRLSDVTGRRRIFIKTGLLAASVAFFLQIFMYDVVSMMAIRSLAGFTMGIFYFPLIAQISSQERYKKALGRFGGYGSLGWVAGLAIAGIVTSYNLIFMASGIFLLAAFLFSVFLPDLRESRIHIPLFPKAIIKRNLKLYLSVIIRHTGAFSVWVIFPLYLAGLGFDKTTIAFLFALNPVTQIFMTQIVGHFSEKRDEGIFIKFSFLASLATFLILLSFTDIAVLGLSMLVLGTSWGFLWAGSIIRLTSRNLEKATATGILGSVLGISAVVGPLIGGLLSQFFGFQATFVFAALASLVAFLIALRI